MGTRVGGYSRCSGETQLIGTTMDVQRERIEKYCSFMNLELVEVYSDPATISAIPFRERPSGSKLMDAVRNDEIQGIVVASLDRLVRHVIDCLQTVDILDAANASLHIIDIGGVSIDSRTSAGRFMLTMFSAASELEKANIRARVASGREKRIREHQKIGTTPFGFKLAEDNKTLIPNGKEYEALQLIRQLRPTTSLPKIASHLNNHGYVTQHGKTWSPGHVDSILRRKSI